MFFLINFSYKQGLGIHTRLLPLVIPAQAGIQTLVFQKYFKAAVTSNFWIPACAGMTAEVSAKLVALVFRRPFASLEYIVAWALPTIMLGKRGRLKFWG